MASGLLRVRCHTQLYGHMHSHASVLLPPGPIPNLLHKQGIVHQPGCPPQGRLAAPQQRCVRSALRAGAQCPAAAAMCLQGSARLGHPARALLRAKALRQGLYLLIALGDESPSDLLEAPTRGLYSERGSRVAPVRGCPCRAAAAAVSAGSCQPAREGSAPLPARRCRGAVCCRIMPCVRQSLLRSWLYLSELGYQRS